MRMRSIQACLLAIGSLPSRALLSAEASYLSCLWSEWRLRMLKASILLWTGGLWGKNCSSSYLTHWNAKLLQMPVGQKDHAGSPFESLIIFVSSGLSNYTTAQLFWEQDVPTGMTTPVLVIAEFQLGCSLEFHLHFSIAQLALKKSL